tara:strand:+ start:662 stop:1441 length:780 start_codon:yes stop_codon:yes gene_type:complete
MYMVGTVVIKWGGGLITYKDELCKPNLEVIRSLAEICSKTDKKLVIVHGAGSFGHLKAKNFRLAEGRVEGLQQDHAVVEVRQDMLELNHLVVTSLKSRGLDVRSFPPHEWAEGTGPFFSGDLPLHSGVTVVYGDVVEDQSCGFGILSGDDLMVRYATEIPDVVRVIFAVHGVDGILSVPPDKAGPNDLIKVWSPGMEFEGEHASEIDVTGGIGLKAARGAMIAQHGIEVTLVNGENYERLYNAIEGKSVIGTRIIAGNS